MVPLDGYLNSLQWFEFLQSIFHFHFHFLVDFAAIARTVGHLSKSAEVMKLVNNLMKAPQMAVSMQEFSKEMIKVSSLSQFTLHQKTKEDSFNIDNGINGWHCNLWNFKCKNIPISSILNRIQLF